MKHRPMCSFVVATVALMVSAGAYHLTAQSSTNANSAPPLAFEVASVKPNKAGPFSRRAGLPPGERVTMINVPLLTLVQIAYPGMSAIVGGPAWMGRPGEPNFDAARFDLNAKSEAPASTDQLRLMLQTLLGERFKLAVHTEMRQADVYALRPARADGRLGPNLRPAVADCRRSSPQTRNLRRKHPCGTVGTNSPPWHVRGVPITQLLVLQIDLGRPMWTRPA